MKITRVKIRKFENDKSGVKALVEVTLDDCFVVKDIRVIEKPEKMVVAMPSKTVSIKGVDESFDTRKKHKDLAHPINAETREMFNSTILGVYERADSLEYEETF